MAKADSRTRNRNRNRNLYTSPSEGNNRLELRDGGTSANCDVVGLLPFNFVFDVLSHEIALGIQLAIQHLNEGNGTLVPEVKDLQKTCPITFSSSFADTERNPTAAFVAVDKLTRSALEHEDLLLSSLQTDSNSASTQTSQTNNNGMGRRKLPCAFVGAVDSQISKTTALITGLRGFPQISPISASSALSDNKDYPLFGRTCSDDAFKAKIFVKFLHDTLKIRHFFVIYESHSYPRSSVKNLRDAIEELGWAPADKDDANMMYMQDRMIDSWATSQNTSFNESVTRAANALKESEYRCVLAVTSDVKVTDRVMEIVYDDDGPLAGIINGTYQWWLFLQLSNQKYDKGSILAKAYSGVGHIDANIYNEGGLYLEFEKQSQNLKQELYKSTNDTAPGTSRSEWLFASDVPILNESAWLQDGNYKYDVGAFAYDATILLGLSACNKIAETSGNNQSLFLSGSDYFKSITQTNFTGVTGNVVLDSETGTRNGESLNYAIHNWLPSDDGDSNNTKTTLFRDKITHVYEPGGEDVWDAVDTFVFSSNTTSLGPNPGVLPVEIESKVVSPWMQGLALGLAAITLLATLGIVIWTCRHWNSRVIRASQPVFLLLLCFGITLMTLTNIPISIEYSGENQGNPLVCNFATWLLVIGFGITFSALFAKTYRINKIIASAKRCRRIKLSVKDTLYPVAIIFFFNVIMLSLQMKFGPITHDTFYTFDAFGRKIEKYSKCMFRQAMPIFYVIGFVNFGMVGLALFQAWRAWDLSTEFAESRYIVNALSISCIVIILAVPVFWLTENNPNSDTFINTTVVFVFTTSVLCSIFFPKINMHYKSASAKPITSGIASIRKTATYGERILTTKPRRQLASENKTLKKENASLKKSQITLELQIASLQQRLQKCPDGENNLNGGESENESGHIIASTAICIPSKTDVDIDSEFSDSSDGSEVVGPGDSFSLGAGIRKTMSLNRFSSRRRRKVQKENKCSLAQQDFAETRLRRHTTAS